MKKRGDNKTTLLPRDIIMQELRQRIESSLPGTRLPSENALSLKFNMARMTVTRVFNQLEEEGLIERRKGCGSFVKGMRTVTFFLPYPEFIVEQGSMAEVFRSRLHGAIRASQDMRLKLNIFPVLKERGAFYSPQVFQDFSPANLVITSSLMPESFQYLFEHKIRTVMFNDKPVSHGEKQYTYDWIIMEKDYSSAVRAALEKLSKKGCRKIAAVDFGADKTVFSVLDSENITVLFPENCSTRIQQQEFLRNACIQHNFDGVLLHTELSLTGKSINSCCALPDNIEVVGIDILPEKCHLEQPFCIGSSQEGIMGYDAVKYLAESSRMGIRKKYEHIFENTDVLNNMEQ